MIILKKKIVYLGLGGNTAVVQVGDPSNFIHLNFKHYDFRDVPKALNLDSSYLFGAGGGADCSPYVESFSEVVCLHII